MLLVLLYYLIFRREMKMTNEANGYAYQNDPALSDKWKFRFDFFQKHGVSELWGGNAGIQKCSQST